MPWISRLLRGDRVYARAAESPSDAPLATGSDGRVDILYNRKGGKVYRAAAKNLLPDPRQELLSDEDVVLGAPASADKAVQTRLLPDGNAAPPPRLAAPAPVAALPSRPAQRTLDRPPAKDPIIVYADGACSGNPGPAGLGVVLLDGRSRRELSEYLGIGTNNIAEIMAIVRALEELPRDRTVIVHSDSSYALGLLGKGWKAKANQELVERMRRLAATFRDLRLVKVAGHAGVVENERADVLARDAVTKRR